MYSQSDLKELVEKALAGLSYYPGAPGLFDPVKYILSIGGKRLRPVMALTACNIFTDKISEAVLPSAGIEVFHNFTLVHDDIMDQASLRRGFQTIHNKWNLNQAVLSGDVMAFIANECFLMTPHFYLHKVFKIFNKAAIEVCAGQQLDIEFENKTVVSQAEYLEMIELKTAVLLAASLKIGSVIGGADDRDSDALYEMGRNLGLAFQIQDDILDVWGDSKIFGKKPGGDIVANKKTLPLVKAMELASGKQLGELKNLYTLKEGSIDPDEKISKVIKIYDDLKILDLTKAIANGYIDNAYSMLKMLSAGEARKKEMTNLVISLIDRKF